MLKNSLTKKKSTENTNRRGKDTTLSIITAAKDVFISQGYAALSIRKVATKAGISVGNLTYHFPSKQSLIESMFDSILEDYLLEFDHQLTDNELSPQDKLYGVIEYIFTDLANPKTTVLFPELWALANHEQYATFIIEQIYTKARSVFISLIPQINSSLTEQQIQDIALFMSASIEGHTMFVGANKQFSKSIKRLIKLAQQSFLTLINNPPAP